MAGEKPSFDTMPSLLLEVQKNQQNLQKQIAEFQKTFEQNSKGTPKEILTITEACDLLGIDRSTLYRWQKEGIISSYGIEKRRYYKYSDIIGKLTPLTN